MNDPKSEHGAARTPATVQSAAVTLAQVAQVAGVSTITASRALNNPRMVLPETASRIREIAQRLGYVPNLLAGGLKSRRSRLVAVLLPAIAGSPFLRMIQALTDSLAEQGYQVIWGQTGYDGGREAGLLDAIIGRRPDGIVVAGLVRTEAARAKLRASGIAIVETWDFCEQPLDMLVGLSHVQVGAAVARYLWGRGRRRFGIASAHDSRGAQRRDGFLQTLHGLAQAEGLSLGEVPQFSVPAPSSAASGREALAALLAADPAMDALYCSSDMLALGVLFEAMARGIQVPGQLAVFGYGDVDLAACSHPGLSTVRVDDIAIGREAARRILARVAGQTVSPQVVDVGFSIVERGST